MGKFIDETGNKYGFWTVLYLVRKNNKIFWNCRCKCGTERLIKSADLRRGHTTSCGCKKNRNLDLTNKKFGRLLVEYRVDKKHFSNFVWHCKCDCGNECETTTRNLVQGITKSCGCLQREIAGNNKRKYLVGQKFGMLTVLEEVSKRNSNQKILYKCKCECGNVKNIIGAHLLDGNTMSCGCMKMSHGEYKIKSILIKNNIDFIQEYHPNNFKYFQNARYDFYIPKTNILIEYDGKQHFIENYAGWNDSLQNIQKRDKLKNKWAMENNYNLIRIPYTHYNDLCLEDLTLTSKFLFKYLKKEKIKNAENLS